MSREGERRSRIVRRRRRRLRTLRTLSDFRIKRRCRRRGGSDSRKRLGRLFDRCSVSAFYLGGL